MAESCGDYKYGNVLQSMCKSLVNCKGSIYNITDPLEKCGRWANLMFPVAALICLIVQFKHQYHPRRISQIAECLARLVLCLLLLALIIFIGFGLYMTIVYTYYFYNYVSTNWIDPKSRMGDTFNFRKELSQHSDFRQINNVVLKLKETKALIEEMVNDIDVIQESETQLRDYMRYFYREETALMKSPDSNETKIVELIGRHFNHFKRRILHTHAFSNIGLMLKILGQVINDLLGNYAMVFRISDTMRNSLTRAATGAEFDKWIIFTDNIGFWITLVALPLILFHLVCGLVFALIGTSRIRSIAAYSLRWTLLGILLLWIVLFAISEFITHPNFESKFCKERQGKSSTGGNDTSALFRSVKSNKANVVDQQVTYSKNSEKIVTNVAEVSAMFKRGGLCVTLRDESNYDYLQSIHSKIAAYALNSMPNYYKANPSEMTSRALTLCNLNYLKDNIIEQLVTSVILVKAEGLVRKCRNLTDMFAANIDTKVATHLNEVKEILKFLENRLRFLEIKQRTEGSIAANLTILQKQALHNEQCNIRKATTHRCLCHDFNHLGLAIGQNIILIGLFLLPIVIFLLDYVLRAFCVLCNPKICEKFERKIACFYKGYYGGGDRRRRKCKDEADPSDCRDCPSRSKCSSSLMTQQSCGQSEESTALVASRLLKAKDRDLLEKALAKFGESCSSSSSSSSCDGNVKKKSSSERIRRAITKVGDAYIIETSHTSVEQSKDGECCGKAVTVRRKTSTELLLYDKESCRGLKKDCRVSSKPPCPPKPKQCKDKEKKCAKEESTSESSCEEILKRTKSKERCVVGKDGKVITKSTSGLSLKQCKSKEKRAQAKCKATASESSCEEILKRTKSKERCVVGKDGKVITKSTSELSLKQCKSKEKRAQAKCKATASESSCEEYVKRSKKKPCESKKKPDKKKRGMLPCFKSSSSLKQNKCKGKVKKKDTKCKDSSAESSCEEIVKRSKKKFCESKKKPCEPEKPATCESGPCYCEEPTTSRKAAESTCENGRRSSIRWSADALALRPPGLHSKSVYGLVTEGSQLIATYDYGHPDMSAADCEQVTADAEAETLTETETEAEKCKEKIVRVCACEQPENIHEVVFEVCGVDRGETGRAKIGRFGCQGGNAANAASNQSFVFLYQNEEPTEQDQRARQVTAASGHQSRKRQLPSSSTEVQARSSSLSKKRRNRRPSPTPSAQRLNAKMSPPAKKRVIRRVTVPFAINRQTGGLTPSSSTAVKQQKSVTSAHKKRKASAPASACKRKSKRRSRKKDTEHTPNSSSTGRRKRKSSPVHASRRTSTKRSKPRSKSKSRSPSSAAKKQVRQLWPVAAGSSKAKWPPTYFRTASSSSSVNEQGQQYPPISPGEQSPPQSASTLLTEQCSSPASARDRPKKFAKKRRFKSSKFSYPSSTKKPVRQLWPPVFGQKPKAAFMHSSSIVEKQENLSPRPIRGQTVAMSPFSMKRLTDKLTPSYFKEAQKTQLPPLAPIKEQQQQLLPSSSSKKKPKQNSMRSSVEPQEQQFYFSSTKRQIQQLARCIEERKGRLLPSPRKGKFSPLSIENQKEQSSSSAASEPVATPVPQSTEDEHSSDGSTNKNSESDIETQTCSDTETQEEAGTSKKRS